MNLRSGVLLDPHTGRPELAEIQDKLRRAAEPGAARGGMQIWREVLYATIADATPVTAAAETVMVPDFTFPPNYLYPGRLLKYGLHFKYSTVITTPGTITMRLRWGGVSGTILAASGAYAPDPTAAGVDITGYVEWTMMCRATGTSAGSIAFGSMWLGDNDDASAAALKNNLDMSNIPPSGPAVVNINTTVAAALSPTWQQSVATGSMTVLLAILESLT